jgi:putative PEP-CTERM system histidine kinase
VLALVVLVRARRSIPRWAFAAGMAVFAAESTFAALSNSAETLEAMMAWQHWRMVSASLLPGAWLVFSLTYARGNAPEFLARWKWGIAGALAVPVALATLPEHSLVLEIGKADVGQHWVLRVGLFGAFLSLHLLVGAVAVLVNLERTFRASVGTIRWRIKYMLLGLGVVFAVRVYTSSQVLLFSGVDLALLSVNSGALLAAIPLVGRTLLRSGHFAEDVYPPRGVLTNSVTVLFVGIYLLAVGVFAKIARFLGGEADFTLKAFVVLLTLVALAIVTQSDHARLTVRRFVNRWFHRPAYDYRQVWRKFTEATASRVDQADLSRALVRLVSEQLQALSVSIWLVDDARERLVLAASTSLSDARGDALAPTRHDASAAIWYLQQHPAPIDLETIEDSWAEALRQCHPPQFPNGGHRMAVPITSGGDVLGVLLLGDRVGGIAYSIEDLDLLEGIGDHASASLLSARLSRSLMQARELEAFQSMAAFFVHDLKNAASTLGLLLRNLPEHYDDPEFRADALRGIGKTVDHINGMIGRLSLLRHEMKIQPVEASLDELAEAAVAEWKAASNVALVRKLGAAPRVRVDEEQMLKVLTNLVLNARDAVEARWAAGAAPAVADAGAPAGESGRVEIATRVDHGWAVLEVADNGCGMSQEFLQRSLFRPFQTTKKGGLGIGMFQSKTIVEAHGGRMKVESQPGRGTTFQVFLPLAPPPVPATPPP